MQKKIRIQYQYLNKDIKIKISNQFKFTNITY